MLLASFGAGRFRIPHSLSIDGEVIARWSRYGYQAGRLVWPHDLAVSARAEVFVGEVFDANRVQRFRPECDPAAATG